MMMSKGPWCSRNCLSAASCSGLDARFSARASTLVLNSAYSASLRNLASSCVPLKGHLPSALSSTSSLTRHPADAPAAPPSSCRCDAGGAASLSAGARCRGCGALSLNQRASASPCGGVSIDTSLSSRSSSGRMAAVRLAPAAARSSAQSSKPVAGSSSTAEEAMCSTSATASSYSPSSASASSVVEYERCLATTRASAISRSSATARFKSPRVTATDAAAVYAGSVGVLMVDMKSKTSITRSCAASWPMVLPTNSSASALSLAAAAAAAAALMSVAASPTASVRSRNSSASSSCIAMASPAARRESKSATAAAESRRFTRTPKFSPAGRRRLLRLFFPPSCCSCGRCRSCVFSWATLAPGARGDAVPAPFMLTPAPRALPPSADTLAAHAARRS
mmetsp:Transcript_6416/g.25981  ORF Transcript_6416/g.25981 Transcript_6416/m.25981 type:complete len:395 (-) Transcript_6416:101-1285(-)